MIFRADDKQCELKGYVYGDMKTHDNERKLKLADTRVWEARNESRGAAGQ
jgi:hypothetical protein